ncbi:MAG: hypothetical protein AAB262_11695 [Elusimicrobiota bacterium]
MAKTVPAPYSDQNAELVRLRHAIPELMAALVRYGRHDYGCASTRYMPGHMPIMSKKGIMQPCDCGFDEATTGGK